MYKDRIELLIEIILDPNAADHEKDDAAMDLAEFDDDRALDCVPPCKIENKWNNVTVK